MLKKAFAIIFSMSIIGGFNPSITTNAKENKNVLENGTYQITSAANTKLAFDENTNISNKLNTNNQKWNIQNDKSGDFIITNVSTNQVLDIEKNELTLSEKDNSQSKKWKIQKTTQGYKIISANKKNSCLTISDINTTSDVSLEKKNDSQNQNWTIQTTNAYSGPVLNTSAGSVQGPSGRETYYNLDMTRVVSAMQSRGFHGEYWVRSDGVKMFGDYVMVAAELGSRPYGTLIETSLGMGIVCDTGGFAANNPTQLDIATNW